MEKGNEIKTVVPALRFPEFQNTESWKEYKLKSLCEIGNGKDYKHLGRGNIPVYGSGGYMTSVDDFLYDGESVCIGRKGTIDKPIFLTGKFWTVDTLFYTHSFHNCLPKFLYLIFQQINWYKYNEAGGVPSLSKTTIGEINVFVPVGEKGELKEQQKIVDCIFSLNELIEATAQKVEALKEHKKGLIQRLFPTGSKDVPDLRFPEFQGVKKWERKIIQDICNITTGNKNTQDKKENGIYPFFVRSPKVERIDSWSFDGEAILTAGDGVGVGKIFHYYVGKMGVHQRVYLLYNIQCNSKYLYYFFSEFFYERVKKMSAKNSVDSVRKDMISDMPLLLPSFHEQEKIADCLSSLDELIEVTSRKVEILKEHKKGLMQQLFPKI